MLLAPVSEMAWGPIFLKWGPLEMLLQAPRIFLSDIWHFLFN